MQAIQKEDNWVRCPVCKHKLFKTISDEPMAIAISSESFVDGVPRMGAGAIEIKCHSCKEIVKVYMKEYLPE